MCPVFKPNLKTKKALSYFEIEKSLDPCGYLNSIHSGLNQELAN